MLRARFRAGFIQKLPTQLVAAFRATLEEIRDASLLLHVVDASHPSAAAQVRPPAAAARWDDGMVAAPADPHRIDMCSRIHVSYARCAGVSGRCPLPRGSPPTLPPVRSD